MTSASFSRTLTVLHSHPTHSQACTEAPNGTPVCAQNGNLLKIMANLWELQKTSAVQVARKVVPCTCAEEEPKANTSVQLSPRNLLHTRRETKKWYGGLQVRLKLTPSGQEAAMASSFQESSGKPEAPRLFAAFAPGLGAVDANSSPLGSSGRQ